MFGPRKDFFRETKGKGIPWLKFSQRLISSFKLSYEFVDDFSNAIENFPFHYDVIRVINMLNRSYSAFIFSDLKSISWWNLEIDERYIKILFRLDVDFWDI